MQIKLVKNALIDQWMTM